MKWVGLTMLGLASCATWSEPDINTALDVMRGTCVAAESQIVNREGTTMEQDKADLKRVRAICDCALQLPDIVQ